MKTSVLLSAAGIMLLFLAACAPSAAGQPSSPQVASPASGAQPSPASGGAVQGQPAAPSGGTTEVDITLADNTIQSSLTTFKAGVPYRFIIINNGNHQHDLNISTPVEKAGSIEAAASTALVSVPQTKLPPGGGTQVDFTFPASSVGQPLEFSCLIRRHYNDGMRLAITVTQ